MLSRTLRRSKLLSRLWLIPRPVFEFTSKNPSTRWYKDHVNDPYVKMAQDHDFRSRAAFKLIEIDDRYRLIRKAHSILDLGCAPGSWTQVLAQRMRSGNILGIDIEPIKAFESGKENVKVKFIEADITEEKTHVLIYEHFKAQKIDMIVSDLSPGLVGETEYDGHEIINLNKACVDVAESVLKKGGTLLMKTFRGPFEGGNFEFCKFHFKSVIRIKPSASRSRSPELYYLCQGYKETPFWELVEKKGSNISLDDFQSQFANHFSLDEKELEKFEELVATMFEQGKFKSKDLKFKFEKEIFERARKKLPDIREKMHEIENMSGPELMASVDEMYEIAVKNKLARPMPSNYEQSLEMFEKEKDRLNAQIRQLRNNEEVSFELLDLDKDILADKEGSVKSDDGDDDLPSDFKYPWEPGYDDFIIKSLEEEVIKPTSKNDMFDLIQKHADSQKQAEEYMKLYEALNDIKESDEIDETKREELKEAFAEKMQEYEDSLSKKEAKRGEVMTKEIIKQADRDYEIFKQTNPELFNKEESPDDFDSYYRHLERVELTKEGAKESKEKNKDINNPFRRHKKKRS